MTTLNENNAASVSSSDRQPVTIGSQASIEAPFDISMMNSKKTTKRRKKLHKLSHSSTSNLGIAPMYQMSTPNCAPINLPIRHKAGFTDLPLEILTMISTYLLKDFMATKPKAPDDEDLGNIVDLLEADLRIRAMSFFATHQVNRSMRNACRIAFCHRMSMAADTIPSFVDRRIRLEERSVREFDKCQAMIVAQEKVRLLDCKRASNKRLADKELQRSIGRARRAGFKELQDDKFAEAERLREEQLASIDRAWEEQWARLASSLSAIRVNELLRLSFLTTATGGQSSFMDPIIRRVYSMTPL